MRNKTVVFVFVLVIMASLSCFTYADNVEIKLGSGDGFKVLDSGGSPLMDILSNGKVGIGTSPNYELDVSGDINFTGSLYQNGSIFSGSAWTTSGSDIYFDSGNVGIGTTSFAHTSAKLEVNTGTNQNFAVRGPISLSSGVSLQAIQDDQSTDANLEIYAGASQIQLRGNPITFYNNGERMRITNSGNVGIGTTSPGAKLDVAGGIKTTQSGSTVLSITPDSTVTITHNLGTNSLTILAVNGDFDANTFTVKGVDPVDSNSFKIWYSGGQTGNGRFNWIIFE